MAEEIHWWLYEMGKIQPELWRQFVEPIPEAERDDLLEAFWKRRPVGPLFRRFFAFEPPVVPRPPWMGFSPPAGRRIGLFPVPGSFWNSTSPAPGPGGLPSGEHQSAPGEKPSSHSLARVAVASKRSASHWFSPMEMSLRNTPRSASI